MMSSMKNMLILEKWLLHHSTVIVLRDKGNNLILSDCLEIICHTIQDSPIMIERIPLRRTVTS
jgi:hypothetical protein